MKPKKRKKHLIHKHTHKENEPGPSITIQMAQWIYEWSIQSLSPLYFDLVGVLLRLNVFAKIKPNCLNPLFFSVVASVRCQSICPLSSLFIDASFSN